MKNLDNYIIPQIFTNINLKYYHNDNMQNNIKQVFEDEDFMKDNKWFFLGNWKDIEIKQFGGKDNWLEWKNGTWYNGTWQNGTWHNGTWKDGTWNGGEWKNGTWYNGKWNGGMIWSEETKMFRWSDVNPRECEWSLSYKK